MALFEPYFSLIENGMMRKGFAGAFKSLHLQNRGNNVWQEDT